MMVIDNTNYSHIYIGIGKRAVVAEGKWYRGLTKGVVRKQKG
jgi:hypothetical protein